MYITTQNVEFPGGMYAWSTNSNSPCNSALRRRVAALKMAMAPVIRAERRAIRR